MTNARHIPTQLLGINPYYLKENKPLKCLGVSNAFGHFGEVVSHVYECDFVASYHVVDNCTNATFASGIKTM